MIEELTLLEVLFRDITPDIALVEGVENSKWQVEWIARFVKDGNDGVHSVRRTVLRNLRKSGEGAKTISSDATSEVTEKMKMLKRRRCLLGYAVQLPNRHDSRHSN